VFRRLGVITILASFIFATTAYAVEIDPTLPPYQPVAGVSGNLKAVGSDTLNNLMTLWAEGFRGVYPNVKISVEGKGSSTAPPALIEGTAQFGPMSRDMKSKEIDEFEKKFGYKPSVVRVAVDALAVFVNKDNPINCLSLRQLDAIFSITRKGGFRSDIKSWGGVGLAGAWKNKPISLYGRNSASGTYAYFKEVALFQGDFRNRVKEQPGSSAVVQGIASDKYAIGYSGIGYKTADVKAISITAQPEKCFEPTANNAYTGDYPLARFLYIYFNKAPQQPLDPLMTEFIKYIFSREGQTIVVKDGFFPVSKALADEDMHSVGIE
jgi:phosphate transport system substrate-binding protein